MTRPRKALWIRVLGALLVVASLGWTTVLLSSGWEFAELERLSPRLLPSVLAFVLASASLVVAFPAFWWLVRSSGAQSPPILEFSQLHFVSQLMRHLPGRFIGVAYQVAIARHIASASQWVGANTAYMVMALWFSVVIPLSILLVLGRAGPLMAASGLAALLVAPPVGVLLFKHLGRIAGPPGRKGVLFEVAAAVLSCVRSSAFGYAIAWFAASWVVYGLAWAALGASLSGVSVSDALALCAFYSLAWAVGFVAVLTPSGLGVRELAFAALASEFPPEVVAYVAVVARLGLLGADLFLGATSLWIGRWKNG